MGGIGSGRRYRYGSKITTDDYRSIDVRRLHRLGLLKPKLEYGWKWSRNEQTTASINIRTASTFIYFRYRHRKRSDENWNDYDYPVNLEWTSCHIGGQRPWFICPARGCGRRVAILYSDALFVCRHCLNLVFESQRLTPGDRAARRADKIREKLNWFGGILEGNGARPKGMHRKMFKRLSAEHDAFKHAALRASVYRFNLTHESIEAWW